MLPVKGADGKCSFKAFNMWFENEPVWVVSTAKAAVPVEESAEDEDGNPIAPTMDGAFEAPSKIVDKLKAAKERHIELKKLGKKKYALAMADAPQPDDILRALFQKLDTNRLGELNKDELHQVRVLRPGGAPAPTAALNPSGFVCRCRRWPPSR